MASYNLSGPAMTPPDGETADFDNPPNDNSLALGAFMLMFVVSTLCVAIRIYAKLCVVRKVQPEDGMSVPKSKIVTHKLHLVQLARLFLFPVPLLLLKVWPPLTGNDLPRIVFIILAYVAFLATFWTDMMFMKYPGYFVHTWNATLESDILSTYYVFLFGVFYSIALAMLKVSIPLEWSRLFVPPGTRLKSYFWWGTMIVVALQSSFLIVILVLLNVQCIPHRAIWDVTIQSTAKCISLTILQRLSASVHLASDIVIFLLPQKIIYDLNLTIQKKLGLGVVFSLGALAIVCSVFRLYDTLKLATEVDILYFTGPVLLWCTAEITCGFFVACAPILPRVVKEIPGLRNMFGGRSTRPHSSAGFGRNLNTIGGGGTGPHRVRNTDPYSQIDDDGVPLDELKASESTEHLGKAAQLGRSNGIICTTQIEVTRDDDSNNNVAVRGSTSPWEEADAVPGSIRP